MTIKTKLLLLCALTFAKLGFAQEIEGERSPMYNGLYDYAATSAPSGYYEWRVYGGDVNGEQTATNLRDVQITWTSESSEIGKFGEGYINLIIYEDQTKSKVIESEYKHITFELPCKSETGCDTYDFTCNELKDVLAGYDLSAENIASWESAFKFYHEVLKVYPQLSNCDLGDFDTFLHGKVPCFDHCDDGTNLDHNFKDRDLNIIMPAAQARIIKHRQADLDIRYIGNTIPDGMTLSIAQLNHHFSFGTSIKEDRLDFNTADDFHFNNSHISGYLDIVQSLRLNKIVPEGRFKYRSIKRFDKQVTNAVTGMNLFLENLDYLFGLGFQIRGHAIIAENLLHFLADNPDSGYDICNSTMSDSECFSTIKTQVLAMVDKRFSTLQERFPTTNWSDYITEWDIVNHPIKDLKSLDLNSCSTCINHNYDDHIADFYDPLFQKVASQCEGCDLYLNEDFVIFGNSNHYRNYRDKIAQLTPLGLTGIGLQSHYIFNDMYLNGNLKRNYSAGYAYNQLTNLNNEFPELALQITEFDYAVRTGIDEDDKVLYDNEIVLATLADDIPNLTQNQLTSTQMNDSKILLTTFFSHPGVDGIVVWGFVDQMPDNQSPAILRGLHWRPNASFYKWEADGLVPRAGTDWFKQLMTEEWMTHETLEVGNARNDYERIFKGTYEFSLINNAGEVVFQSGPETIHEHSELTITFDENIQINIKEKQ